MELNQLLKDAEWQTDDGNDYKVVFVRTTDKAAGNGHEELRREGKAPGLAPLQLKLELIKIILSALTLVGIVFAILTYLFTVQEKQAEIAQQKRKEAMWWVNHADELFSKTVRPLEGFLLTMNVPEGTVIPADLMYKIFHSSPKQREFWEARAEIISFLNQLESMCTAALDGAADRNIIKRSLRPSIEEWMHRLHSFIEEADRANGRKTWEPIQILMEQWHQEDLAPQATQSNMPVAPHAAYKQH